MAITFNDNILNRSPKALDAKQGIFQAGAWRPYADTDEAINTIPIPERYIGLMVDITDENGTIKYWFKDGISNEDLVPFGSASLELKANQGLHVSDDGFVQLGGDYSDEILIGDLNSPQGNLRLNNTSALLVAGNLSDVSKATINAQNFFGQYYNIDLRAGAFLGANRAIIIDNVVDRNNEVGAPASIWFEDTITERGAYYAGDYSIGREFPLDNNWIPNAKWILDTFALAVDGGYIFASPSTPQVANINIDGNLKTSGGSSKGITVGATLNIYTGGTNTQGDVANIHNVVGGSLNFQGYFADFNSMFGVRLPSLSLDNNPTQVLTVDNSGYVKYLPSTTFNPLLVSGTNIKTINGINILGSGNIDVSGGSGGATTWGNIGGNLADQTDLTTALNGKQNLLNGTGFVKSTGGTISYDNTSYYPSSNPAGYITSFTETDPTVPAYSKSLTAFNVIKDSTDVLYEPIFTKNTAFNKNFGTTANTVTEGNDSRVNNGQTAFDWGNHATAGYYLASNPNNYISSVPPQSFASLTGKPTTLSGYGITDAYPLTDNPSGFLTSSYTPPSQVQNSLTPNSTTLAPSVNAVNNGLDVLNSVIDTRPSKGLIIGDSTIASYLDQNSVASYIITNKDVLSGNSITDISVPGHTIAQQKAAFLALSDKNTYDYIIVEIGLNDVGYTESNDAVIARLQDFINTINLNKKVGCKIIIGAMIPAKQRWISSFGGVNGLTSYEQWIAINSAIMGNGDNAILGVDSRQNSHERLLNDGLGNLSSIYDMGDFIHENNIAREIIANEYRRTLNNFRFLKSSTPIVSPPYQFNGLKSNKTISLPNLMAGIGFNAYTDGTNTRFITDGYSHFINTSSSGALSIGVSGNNTSGYGAISNYTDIFNLNNNGINIFGRTKSSLGFEKTLINNQKNDLFRFDNAPNVGVSYFAGSSGIGGFDTFGFHFGNPTSDGSKFRMIDKPSDFAVEIDGRISSTNTISAGTLTPNTSAKLHVIGQSFFDGSVYVDNITAYSGSKININSLNGLLVNNLSGTGDRPVLAASDGTLKIGSSSSGSVTNVSSANADIGVANPTTTPVLTLNSNTVSGANTVAKRDANGAIGNTATGVFNGFNANATTGAGVLSQTTTGIAISGNSDTGKAGRFATANGSGVTLESENTGTGDLFNGLNSSGMRFRVANNGLIQSRNLEGTGIRGLAADADGNIIIGSGSNDAFKPMVRVATTTNIALSGLITVDGVTVVAGDRVLVKNQTTASQNGIYIASSGTWSRADDSDSATKLTGSTVTVMAGTINSGSLHIQTSPVVTLGTTAVNYLQSFKAGTNIATSGNTISLVTNPSIGAATATTATAKTNTTQVATTAFAAKQFTATGSGTGSATSITVAHGVSGVTNANSVIVSANNAAASGISYCTLDATNVTIVYAVAPASGTNNLAYSISIK